MGDHNQTPLSQSSPKHPISGNNENETENQRNLQQKNKNFMSPTISTVSKFTAAAAAASNKKDFDEWKSSPKSGIGELGNSNFSLGKSLPKIPKNKIDEYYDNGEFVGDSLDVPYDPLTNYLSPRPRFLRYRPRRRREILVKRVERDGTESTDSDSSIESVNSSSEKNIEENRVSNEHVVIDEENEDVDDCEDYIEEESSGFKWVFLKSLIAILAVFLCTVWICSMNSSAENRQVLLDNRMYDVHSMNMSLRIVSLRNLDSRMGMFEINDFDVESDEKLNRVDLESVVAQEIENLEIVESVDDYFQRDPRFLNDDYHFRDRDVEFEVENVGDEGNEVHDLKTESVEVEIEALNIAIELNNGTEAQPMGVVVFEEINADIEKNEVSDSKSDEEHVIIEAPIVASDIKESLGMVHSDSEAENRSLVLGKEAVNASEYCDQVTEEKDGIYFETVVEVSEANSKDGELDNETTVESEPKFDKKQLKLTYNDLIWPVISPMIAFVLLVCFSFYYKCKRTFSKTSSANMKLCTNAAKPAKTKPGLPPKAVEKKTDHSQLNAALVQKGVNDVMIPTVKQLGEFEVAVDFTRPLRGCSVKTELDETSFATPDTKRVLRRGSVSGQPLNSELSTSESYSCGSYISQETTSVKGAKEEVSKATPTPTPTPRRSTRLRNKGVTSP